MTRVDLETYRPAGLWRAQLLRQITLSGPDIRSDLTDPPGSVAGVPDPDILIHATGLTKRFGDFTAVDGIDFELGAVRPSASSARTAPGKSSTMRMIGCVSPPSGGELSILGMDPVSRRPGDQGPARRGAARGHPGRGADRPGEPADLRPVLRPAQGGDRRADGQAAGLRPARRAGRRPGRAAVGRHEAAAHHRQVADQRAGDPDPGRADDRAWTRRPGTWSGTGFSGSSSRA